MAPGARGSRAPPRGTACLRLPRPVRHCDTSDRSLLLPGGRERPPLLSPGRAEADDHLECLEMARCRVSGGTSRWNRAAEPLDTLNELRPPDVRSLAARSRTAH